MSQRYTEPIYSDPRFVNNQQYDDTEQSSYVKIEHTEELKPLDIQDFIAKEDTTENTKPVYNSVLVRMKHGRIRLTDKDGYIVEDCPGWASLPTILGSMFFRDSYDPDKVWDFEGNKQNWVDGKHSVFINNWIVQEQFGKIYINKVLFNGITFVCGEKLSFDNIGYLDHNYAILYKDGLWRKFVYINKYWESPVFSLEMITQRDLSYMCKNGATKALVNDIVKANGYNPNDFVPELSNINDIETYFTKRNFMALQKVHKYTNPEVFSTMENIPLDIAIAAKRLLGSRTYFITEEV